MLKGLGPRATPALKAQLRLRGLNLDNLPPAFPIEDWTPHLVYIAATVFPELPQEQALYETGVTFMRGWQQTLMGSAVSQLLRIVGPARTLPRLERAFRTSNNFTMATATLLSPTSARVVLSDVHDVPTLWAGVLHGGLHILGREGTVDVEDRTPPGCTLLLQWK
jgi:uncharacterized protein (TIGR02265 family)